MYYSDTCWVVERRTGSKTEYATYDVCVEDPGVQWDTQWDRALKFYDRASAEMIAAEMCMDWDIRILEHQIVGTEREIQFFKQAAEIERLKAELELRTREREPIEFTYTVGGGIAPPNEAYGKTFRCVEILEEEK